MWTWSWVSSGAVIRTLKQRRVVETAYSHLGLMKHLFYELGSITTLALCLRNVSRILIKGGKGWASHPRQQPPGKSWCHSDLEYRFIFMSQLILLCLLHARLVSHLNHHRWNILISHSRLIFGARVIITPQPVGVVLNRRTDHVSPQLATQTSTTMAVKPHYLRLSAETRWQLYRRQPFNVKTTWQSLIDWLEWLHQNLYKQIFARYARLFFFA